MCRSSNLFLTKFKIQVKTSTLTGGASWIACEMRDFLTKEHLQFYTDQLQEQIELDESSPLINSMSSRHSGSDAHQIIRNALIGMVEILKKEESDEDR